MSRLDTLRPVPDVTLLDLAAVARLLAVSRRHVRRLADRGAMPPALSIGRCRRWRADVIGQWLEAGAPRVRPCPRKTSTAPTA
jgi:excisionase family DNA binding protein